MTNEQPKDAAAAASGTAAEPPVPAVAEPFVPTAQPVPAPDSAPGPTPELFVPALPAPELKKPRRRLALGLAAALVVVAAGGGAGYAVLHQGGDVKAAGKPWKAPIPKKTAAYGAKSGGSHYGAISKLLLPMPAAYQPGPDVAQYGNDAELNSKQASDLLKQNFRTLPKKQSQADDKAVDEMGIESLGMRTYSIYGEVGYEGEHALVVEIQLLQMKNQRAARAASDFYEAFAKASGTFRKGPKIAGYGDATCILPPREKGVEIDSMICEATEGDLVISFDATGTTPLPKGAAAELLKQQLDRVKDPGEAV